MRTITTDFLITADEEFDDAIRTIGQLLLHRPTTGAMARNIKGEEIGPFHSHAYSFSWLGAVYRVTSQLNVPTAVTFDLIDQYFQWFMTPDKWDTNPDWWRHNVAHELTLYGGSHDPYLLSE